MHAVDILIFVEHKDRELQGTIAVKKYLDENVGLAVKVFSIEYGFFDAWRLYNPKLICLPYCKSENNLIVRAFKARNPNTIYLNLNYEQIFSKVTAEHKRPRDEFAKRGQYHLAWGRQFQEYLQSHGVPSDRIFVAGKPEIQFLQEMKRTGGNLKAEIAKETGLDERKKWCFIPLNDSSAFLSEEFISTKIRAGKFSTAALESHRCAKKQVMVLLQWLFRIWKNRESGNIEFIVRPHPGVDVEKYNELCNELQIRQPENVHIIREYTVKEWLCCSDLCISNWSTVVIDASAIRVRTYIFEPEPLPDGLQTDWIEVFPKIKTFDVFKEVLLENEKKDDLVIDCEKKFIETSIDSVSCWALTMKRLVDLYQEGESISRHTYFAGLKKEWKRMLRSKLRCMVYKKRFARGRINEKIRYDFFEPF